MVNFSHKKQLILGILSGESEEGQGNFILNRDAYELLEGQQEDIKSQSSQLNEE